MFADDTKCFKTIMLEADAELLQLDLDKLSDWSSINELDFQPKNARTSESAGTASVLTDYTA